MRKKPRDNRPYIPPVKRVELSEDNIKFRWIAICVLLAIAAVSIGYGFYSALSVEPGWQEVTVLSDQVNCSGDFKLMYDFSVGDMNPTAAHKKLETRYKELTVSAYRLFSPDAEGTDNLSHINAHVNEIVTVDSGLYAALERVAQSDSRHPYMGPVKALYAPVFLSANDGEAALYDPVKDPELADLAAQTAAYCADPTMIRLEVLGDNRVRLNVSEEYLAFAEENGITAYLDFGWMTNAFIIDYMADALTAEGFAHGYLASYDGFTRNFYGGGKGFSLNIYHCVDSDVYLPGALEYAGPMSLVSLRSYPLSRKDSWHYYAYEDGSITSLYLDPADGMPAEGIDGITAYSRDHSCGEIVLRLAPVFTAETFDAEALELLANEGIESIRCYEKGIVCTDTVQPVKILDSSYELMYSNVE